MEKLKCQCIKCESVLANFVNLWIQVGKGYCSPVVEAEDVKLVTSGPQRDGEKGTLVADCLLQDLVCPQCQSNVGLKCLSSPVNHVLQDQQILLRRAAVRLRSPRARKDTELIIQRSLKLKQPSSQPQQSSATVPGPWDGVQVDETYVSPSTTSLDLERLQMDLDNQRSDIDRLDTAAYQVVSSFDKSVSRIDREMQKLNDTIRSLRQDLDSKSDELHPLKTELSAIKANGADRDALVNLETQMQSTSSAVAAMRKLANGTKTATDSVRAELQTTNTELRSLRTETSGLRGELEVAKKNAKDAMAASREQARQFAALQSEMRQMRDTMAQDRGRRPEPVKQTYPTKELEIITSNMAKMSRETGQVSTLQMEFDLFRSRVGRLEGLVESWDYSHSNRDNSRGTASRVDLDDLMVVGNGQQQHFEHQNHRAMGGQNQATLPRNATTTATNFTTPSKRSSLTFSLDDDAPPTRSSIPDLPSSQPSSSSNRSGAIFATRSAPRAQAPRRGRPPGSAVEKRTATAVRRKSTTKMGKDALDAIYTPPED